MASIIKCPGCDNEIAINLSRCMLCGFQLKKSEINSYKIIIKDEINDFKISKTQFQTESKKEYDGSIASNFQINDNFNSSGERGYSSNTATGNSLNNTNQIKHKQDILFQSLNESNSLTDYLKGLFGAFIGVIVYGIASGIILLLAMNVFSVFGRYFAEYLCLYLFMTSLIVGAYSGGCFAMEVLKKSNAPYFSFRRGGEIGGFIGGAIVSLLASIFLTDIRRYSWSNDTMLTIFFINLSAIIIGIYYGSKVEYKRLAAKISDPDYVYKYFSDRDFK